MDAIGRTRGGHRQQLFSECAGVLSRHYDRAMKTHRPCLPQGPLLQKQF